MPVHDSTTIVAASLLEMITGKDTGQESPSCQAEHVGFFTGHWIRMHPHVMFGHGLGNLDRTKHGVVFFPIRIVQDKDLGRAC